MGLSTEKNIWANKAIYAIAGEEYILYTAGRYAFKGASKIMTVLA